MSDRPTVSPLAIVGMACRFPGAANIEEYWNLVASGENALGPLPDGRMDRRLYLDPNLGTPGKAYVAHGGSAPLRGLIGSYGLPESVVRDADPVHAELLTVVLDAFDHAGVDRSHVKRGRTGVYIGHARGGPSFGEAFIADHAEEISDVLNHVGDLSGVLPGDPQSMRRGFARRIEEAFGSPGPQARRRSECRDIAAIVCDALGTKGPYMAVNAACASSLYALAAAASALSRGTVDLAVVGAASYMDWTSMVLYSGAQALSPTGRSCPFDDSADGFVCSEGYAAVIVKSLSSAIRDGNRVHGVIEGIGISTDGRGKALWAPLQRGQVAAMRRAYSGRLTPNHLQYIEAHGTSTRLGDATELRALGELLGAYSTGGRRVPLASVKSNIGHTREAAGLAGLLRVLLAMREGVMPRAIGFRTPTRQVDWDTLPLTVLTTDREWPVGAATGSRVAAVNAFGIGGLNAHVVIESLSLDRSRHVARQKSLPTCRSSDTKGTTPRVGLAITGVGCILPGGEAVPVWLERLDREEPVSVGLPSVRFLNGATSTVPHRVGYTAATPIDWRRLRMPPKLLEHADPVQHMAVAAASEALEAAGIEQDRRGRTAVVVGTRFGGDFYAELNVALRVPALQELLAQVLDDNTVVESERDEVVGAFGRELLDRATAIRDETGSFTASALASQIAKVLDLQGGAMALDAGDASSGAAVSVATDMLSSGMCDVVVCLGAQRSIDCGWSSAAHVPADGEADWWAGVPLGEGVAALVLERERDVRDRGRKSLGLLRAVGLAAKSDDCWGALRLAVSEAREASGTAKQGLARLQTFLPVGSEASVRERQVTLETYGPVPAGCEILPSPSDRIGHIAGAAGIVGCLRLLHSVGAVGRPAGNANVHGRDLALNIMDSRGLAYHIILGLPQPSLPADVKVTIPAESWRMARFASRTTEGLGECLTSVLEDASDLSRAGVAEAFGPEDRVRLAIVVDGPDMLKAKVRRARGVLDKEGAEAALADQGIHLCRNTERRPRVALLFSGQGSQYPGMLRPLIRSHEGASKALDELEEMLLQWNLPSFRRIAWEDTDRLGKDVLCTQVSLLCAGTILHEVVRGLGVEAHVIGGHSYGEYPALVAAGVITIEQALRLTTHRCELLDRSGTDRGCLWATDAPVAEINARIAAWEGKCGVAVALHNCPQQVIVGGLDRDLRAFFDTMGGNYRVKPLPVPCAFHTPLLTDVEEAFSTVVAEERFYPPSRAFLSSVTNGYTAEPNEIRSNLVKQFTSPLDYPEFVERLIEAGTTHFVEIGPGRVLTTLHRRLLESEPDAVVVACDDARRSGWESILSLQAALEVAGAVTPQEAALPTPLDNHVNGAGVRGEVRYFDATAKRSKASARTEGYQSHRVWSGVRHHRASTAVEMDEGYGQLLIDVVSQETGYPKELIDLDADLEADLGIDSIKRAQIIAQVAEQFGASLELEGSHELADFSTLREIVERLEGTATKGSVEDLLDLDATLGASSDTTGRFILRARDQPHQRSLPPLKLEGAVLILGGGAAAEALVRALDEDDINTLSLVPPSRRQDALLALDGLCIRQDVRHLIVMPPSDANRSVQAWDDGWRDALEHELLLPYFLAQRWVGHLGASIHVRDSSFTVVTALGGDFGLSGNIPRALGGGLVGLSKALRREFPRMRARGIDTLATDPPAVIAAQVVEELRCPNSPAEVGYSSGVRRIVEVVAQPIAQQPGSGSVHPNQTWLVTGGGRGIGSRIAEALGREFGAHLHILGRQPVPVHDFSNDHGHGGGESGSLGDAPESELISNLKRLKDLDIWFRYHSCDVRDRSALRVTLDRIRDESGEIYGIVHCAGTELSAPFTNKEQVDVVETVMSKVDGAAALLELTRADCLKYFVGFGSVSGRAGGIGQTDYSMASELLCKLIQQVSHGRGSCRSAAFHWPAWDEVGMAIRPQTRRALDRRGRRLMPCREGVEHFLRELRSGLPEAEVVIADETVHRVFEVEAGPPAARSAFLSSQTSIGGYVTGEVVLDPFERPELRDHRLGGYPILPAVLSLEIACEVARDDAEGRRFAFEDVRFQKALLFERAQPLRVSTRVVRTERGVSFSLAEARHRATRTGAAPLVSGLLLADPVAATPVAALPGGRPSPREWQDYAYLTEADASAEGRVFHGPALRALEKISIRAKEAWGLACLEFEANHHSIWDSWLIPGHLLDAAMVLCQEFCISTFGVTQLPVAFDSLRIIGRPEQGEQCLVHAFGLHRSPRWATVNVRAFGADGRTLFEALGHRRHLMRTALMARHEARMEVGE